MVEVVKTSVDVEAAISRREKKMKKLGMTVQPFIIVQSTTLDKVDKIFVSISSHIYDVPSMIKALEVCFKSFIVFDLSYPPEGEHLWTYIQWMIYDIYTKYDGKYPNVMSMINRVRSLSNN
ncbi:uncharacterized protein [Prorops nasuta]|uniref:uncharacterized protein n=1 Tax=Prorops nasuta TaxID=863751 RepID=UPI0034CEC3E6